MKMNREQRFASRIESQKLASRVAAKATLDFVHARSIAQQCTARFAKRIERRFRAESAEALLPRHCYAMRENALYQRSDTFEYFVVLSYIFCCSNNLLSLRQSVTIRYVPLYLLFLVWEISTYNPLFIPEHVRWPSRLGIGAFLFVSTVWFKMVYSGISITASTLLLVAVSGWFTDWILWFSRKMK